jgi:hypothetical protein
MRIKVIFAVCFILLANAIIFGQREKFFPLSEVKEGLRGTARTVFKGTVPTEFNVEIIGVLDGGVGPKQDMIIGRLSGGEADRTFVFAGMSGSPVYIDGKLLGSISYSFPFSKEPICGITPIEQIVGMFEKNSVVKAKIDSPKAITQAQLSATDWQPNGMQKYSTSAILADAKFSSLLGQTFQPISTPISFSGFSQETLNQFAPQLQMYGFTAVSAVGSSAKMTPMKMFDDKTLLGGSSVSMQLTRGDYSMAAAGTVTYRDGEKIYAFGHPFLSLGNSDLPMSESHVVTVIPNLNNSFKLAVADSLVGSMTQDRNTGVFGKLGQQPKLIPVKLNVKTSRGNEETYNFEIAKDDFLSPLLMNIAVFNSITATERSLGDTTVTIKGTIDVTGQEPIKIDRRFSSGQANAFTAGSVANITGMLMNSGFQNIDVNKINLDITSFDGSKTAVLDRTVLDRNEVKAGETFEIQAFLRTDVGTLIVQKIPVKVPSDTPAGTLLVSLGDGNSVQQVSPMRQFVPKTLGELIKNINQIKKNDRFYAQLYRITNGAIIGSNELPNLPPSVLATLNSDRSTGGVTPTVLTVLSEQEVAPIEYVVSGQQVLTIDVVK